MWVPFVLAGIVPLRAEHLRYANASVHIPHPKIDELARQA